MQLNVPNFVSKWKSNSDPHKTYISIQMHKRLKLRENVYILRGTRNLSFLTYIKCNIFLIYLEYKHLVCLVMEVGYITFSFHLFKVKFRETLLSYVIYPFFISMHVHDQPENVKRHFF